MTGSGAVSVGGAIDLTRRQNPQCLRGLQFDYSWQRAVLDIERFLARIEGCFPGQLLRAQEPFGGRVCERVVLQFRFELRLEAERSALRLLHRLCAPESIRDQDRLMLERALVEALS